MAPPMRLGIDGPTGATFDRLEALSRSSPDESAFVEFGHSIPYAELHAAVEHLAGYLQQHLGVAPGDRVMHLMPDCPQSLIGRLAIQRCDAVIVALGRIGSVEEIDHFAGRCDARVILLSEDLLPRIEAALAQGRIEAGVVAACADLPGAQAEPHRVPAIDFARRSPRSHPQARRHALHDFADALAAGIEPRPRLVRAPQSAALTAPSPSP